MYLSEKVRKDSKNTGGDKKNKEVEASPQDGAQWIRTNDERKVRENKREAWNWNRKTFKGSQSRCST